MNPIIGSALISGASNLLGNLFGSSSQKSTNEANLKIAQMNNDFNALEAQKSRDFTLDLWNMTNEYNTASSQRQRWEDAGFNPYMMMSGSNAGIASSSGSSAQASSSGNPVMQAFKPDFSGIASAVNSYYQNQYVQKQSQAQGISNITLNDRLLADLARLRGSEEFMRGSSPYTHYYQNQAALRFDLGTDMLHQELRNARFAGQLTQAQQAKTYLDAGAQSIINRYLDQDQQLSLDLKAAMYYTQQMTGQLTLQQARESIARQIMLAAQSKGQRISNRIAEETAGSYIQANRLANDLSSWQSYWRIGKNGSAAKYDAQSERMRNRYDAIGSMQRTHWNSYDKFLNAFHPISAFGVGNLIGNTRTSSPRSSKMSYFE